MSTLESHLLLENPVEYHAWLKNQRQNNSTREIIVEQVLKVGSEIALIRASQICGSMLDFDGWLKFARKAAKAADMMVRQAALIEMTMHEVEINRTNNSSIFEMLTPNLECYIQQLEETQIQTDFIIEIKLRAFLFLSSNLLESRDYKSAYQYASQAIILAKIIELEHLKYVAYSNLALLSLRLENLDEATENYENIIRSNDSSQAIKIFSRINHAVIVNLLGNYKKALMDLENFISINPENSTANIAYQYFKAIIGKISENEDVKNNLTDSHATQTKCLQLLLTNLGESNRKNLKQTISILQSWKPSSPIAELMVKWIQSLAFYRLKLPLIAAKNINSIHSKIPLVSLLLNGLKLEISLSFNGIDVENINTIVEKIEKIFSSCKDTESREGLAFRLAFWHPTAAAFLAFAPICVPELHDSGSRAVFVGGRPITIYEQPVTTRLPFVQKTLEVFGYDANVSRDQSVEQERLNKVLLVDWGDRKHLLPIVPPALIAFQLFRVGESCGSLWKRSAMDLIHSHGLVPTTTGGNLRPERLFLQQLLEDLFEEKIDTQTFRKQLQAHQYSISR
jgi:tetratricopeptide (TPR) repeat protein